MAKHGVGPFSSATADEDDLGGSGFATKQLSWQREDESTSMATLGKKTATLRFRQFLLLRPPLADKPSATAIQFPASWPEVGREAIALRCPLFRSPRPVALGMYVFRTNS